MRGKSLLIGTLMLFATVATASAHSNYNDAPVYGVLPNEGLMYARYPSYGTEYRGTSRVYNHGNYWNNNYDYGNYDYRQHYYKRYTYTGWPYYFRNSKVYATSHHDIVHYVDRPILYPGLYNFRPIR